MRIRRRRGRLALHELDVRRRADLPGPVRHDAQHGLVGDVREDRQLLRVDVRADARAELVVDASVALPAISVVGTSLDAGAAEFVPGS